MKASLTDPNLWAASRHTEEEHRPKSMVTNPMPPTGAWEWERKLQELVQGQGEDMVGFSSISAAQMCQDGTLTLVSESWSFRQTQEPFNPTSSNTDGKTETEDLRCPTGTSMTTFVAFS